MTVVRTKLGPCIFMLKVLKAMYREVENIQMHTVFLYFCFSAFEGQVRVQIKLLLVILSNWGVRHQRHTPDIMNLKNKNKTKNTSQEVCVLILSRKPFNVHSRYSSKMHGCQNK